MIWFKACPRCKVGDLGLAEDLYGKYKQCFQCGHVVYPRPEVPLPVPVPARRAARRRKIAA